MARQDSLEMWTVVVESEDAESSKMYRLPISTPLREVADCYAADVGEAKDIGLLSAEGHPLSSLQTLADVGEVAPGMKMVKFIPMTTIPIKLGYYRRDLMSDFNVCLSWIPDDLHPLVRCHMKIPEDQMFRLRTPKAPLKYNLTLAEQGIVPGNVIEVDFAYFIEVTDEWSGDKTNHVMYSSETCDELMGEGEDIATLTCDGRSVYACGEVIDALIGLGVLPQTEYFFQLHTRREISVLEGSSLRRRNVWPMDELRQIEPRSRGLTFEGEVLPRNRCLSDLDLPEHSLLVSQPVCLEVKLRSGRRMMVRVPRFATVADVRAAVRTEEQNDEFSLTHALQVLDDEEAANQGAFGAADGGPLEVVPRSNCFTVQLRERSVRWTGEGGPQRFSDLMSRVARETDLLYRDLLKRSLYCAGCGRHLCLEEEECQLVPVGCCRVRSLDLLEKRPPAVANIGTQTACRREIKAVISRSSTEADAPLPLPRLASPAPASEQSLEGPAMETIIIPPLLPALKPSEKIRTPFLVVNGTKDYQDGRSFTCSLLLNTQPSAGVLRAALAEFMHRDPDTIRLMRWIGFTRDGDKVVRVCDRMESPSWEFGDNSGRCWPVAEVLERRSVPLDDDAALVTLVLGRRSILTVYPSVVSAVVSSVVSPAVSPVVSTVVSPAVSPAVSASRGLPTSLRAVEKS